MKIELALFAQFAHRYPVPGSGREPRAIDVDEGATVGAIAEFVGIAEERRITFVNGRHADDDRVLLEGDRVAYFPPIAGG